MYNNLLMEVENEIAVVTINRPKSLNALNTETITELNACLQAIAADMTYDLPVNINRFIS